MHMLYNYSVENVDVCKARIGHSIVLPYNGDIGILLKYINFSAIKTVKI